MRIEFRWSENQRVHAHQCQLLLHVGRLHGLQRLAVKLIDDVTGRLCGNKCRPPDGVIGVGKAGFEGRGDVRQSRGAFWAVYRKRGELALANMRQDNADRQKRKVDPSGYYLGYGFRATFEGDVNGLELLATGIAPRSGARWSQPPQTRT